MILLTILFILFLLFLFLVFRFRAGKQEAEKEWINADIRKINIDSTKSLTILPLIDWYPSRNDLKGEAGVSYLIVTDKTSILFDVGLNKKQTDPSPLLHNMKQLGISIEDFNTIVISHNHLDHVGGIKWQKRKSFSLTNYQTDLKGKAVYTPIPMNYPGLEPVCSKEPTVISKGVATTGTISNQDFFMGRISEQALAINVEGKGIVLIVGCGHQTLPKILDRAKTLFKEPVYGILGGLHYPVTDSRIKIMGIKMQKLFGTCRLPWEPITMELVHENIVILKKQLPGIVGLSAHDSCDASIKAFREAFPDVYKDIRVGVMITI
jgi:7,8-dihydropterin-6-yl-methyl-4-(beta-D-ribofuranosyl)aminobenzene 5'-phosphate synthase